MGSVNRSRGKTIIWVYLVAILPALLLLVVIGLQPYVDPSELLRDPIAVAQGAAAKGQCCRFYFGAVSQLGALIWAGGGFIALFASVVIFAQLGPRKDWQFLASAGVITGLLVFDDVFMGHEAMYPKFFGVPEFLTLAGYVGLLALFLWGFRRQIFAIAPGLLAISLTAFAVSVGTDAFVSEQTAWHRLAEDGSKFIGITSWTTFFWWSAFTMVGHEAKRISHSNRNHLM